MAASVAACGHLRWGDDGALCCPVCGTRYDQPGETTMSDDKARGLYGKYNVRRGDGKELGPLGCIVLEFSDALALPALAAWAETMEGAGYVQVAEDVRHRVRFARLEDPEQQAFALKALGEAMAEVDAAQAEEMWQVHGPDVETTTIVDGTGATIGQTAWCTRCDRPYLDCVCPEGADVGEPGGQA